MLHLLGNYEAASGQAINGQKTSIFFSKNTRIEVKANIQGLLGAQVMEDCETYLRLPMVVGKSKVNTFKALQEKINKKVLGWKEKFILKAEREILIKTIAQAIPMYSMGIFKIPQTLYHSINSTLAKYWWSQTKDEKKIHWISWKKLCTPKERGGMGFRDIKAFNLAMLAKQCWRLIHNTHSLFYWVYKSKYFPTCSFMEANLGNNLSYVWRSLLAAREVIREGSIWKVKDGSLIQVSNHKWLPNKPMFPGTPRPQMYVNELIDRATMQWDKEKIFDLFAYRTRMDILSIPLGSNSACDVLVWKENKSQTFTLKSAYQVACKLKEATQVEHSTAASNRHIRSKMWKLNVPPKV